MEKLSREKKMKLSRMHDLGGCRAIMSDLDAVYRLLRLYRQEEDLFGATGPFRCYDYVRSPKPDGYRSVHLVGRYRSRDERFESWDDHRIEIQLRTRRQHAFATAVETVTTFTRQPLKFGGGPEQWRRFFSLMGSALAIREGTPLVDGTPSDAHELVTELTATTEELNVHKRLMGWTSALRALPKRNAKDARWLLLVLDISANTIKVTGYADRQKGSEALAEAEKTSQGNRTLDVVLVGVRSVSELRDAYPNYYADTTQFLSALDTALVHPMRR
jgi:hypothetical protein